MRLLLAVLGLFLVPVAAAQPDANTLTLRLGETAERLAAASDSTQHYALYLPSSYTAEQPAPVLFLMDPRGRALVPLALFRGAAERLGYVVLSSYDTLSDADSAFAVNGRALDAMIQDAQLRFDVDPARLYLIGFSGTAHYSWAVAPALDGHVAGIVGVGDGFRPDDPVVVTATQMQRPFAYFGIAGERDFNYDYAWLRHRGLDGSPIPHRFASFDGPHTWPPKPLADAALDWLELHAVRTGLADRPAEWVDSLYAAHLAEAEHLEATGQRADALQRYQEIAQDFDGLVPDRTAAERAALLARDYEIHQTLERYEELADRVDAYKGTLSGFVAAYREGDLLMPHHRAIRLLDLPRLFRERDQVADPKAAAAAHRMLASAVAWLGFYEPRSYMEAGDYDRAAGLLRLALEINPEAGHVCYRLAQAEAQLGDEDAALDALICALDRQGVRPGTLRTDPLLEPIRSAPRFANVSAPYLRGDEPEQE